MSVDHFCMRNMLKIFLITVGIMCLSVATAAAHQTTNHTRHAHRATRQHAVKHSASHGLIAHTAAVVSPPSSNALDASFACGCIDKTMFPYSSFTPNHTTVVPDPMGSGQNVLKFAVADSDRPYAGDTNPRSDVETAPSFKPGDNDYIAVRTLVPTTMPAVDTNTAWFELAEIYGKPYNGSPTVSVSLSDFGHNGVNHFIMSQDASHNYARAWTGPAADDGQWHTIIFHVNFETNNTGYVQIYFDGQLQTLTNGTTTLHEATLDPGVNWDGKDGNFLNLQSYRSPGSFPGTVTTYEAAPKIATTLTAAE
jgi:hypothetical protein